LAQVVALTVVRIKHA